MKKLIILLVALTISTFTYWCNSVKANPLQSIEGKYKVKLAKLNFPADETKVKNAEELLLILAITLPETRKQLQNKINSISFVELKNNKLYLYDKNGKK